MVQGDRDPRLVGIVLWWAIAGYQQLHQRGELLQPASGAESIRELEDIASPVGTFLRECCVVGPEYSVARADLFEGMSDELLTCLADLSQDQQAPAEAVLFAAGHPADRIYLLQERAVRLSVQPTSLTEQ